MTTMRRLAARAGGAPLADKRRPAADTQQPSVDAALRSAGARHRCASLVRVAAAGALW
ncbi:hypothetical protein [Massilia phosphatilytica]